jgi:23S rRNA pseudouridine1911/1915/1917 synthase
MAGETRFVTVAAADAGERLDRWLARALGSVSRTHAKRLIEEGRVTGGATTIPDPAFKVRANDLFAVEIPEPVADRPRAQAMDLVIPYEDEHLLVVDKPAGLVVHPAPGNPDRTLVNALIAHCGEQLVGIGGVKRPGIVHRLDKDTSGLMVVAKNDLAHRALSEDFASRRIERAYRAFVWGVPEAEGEIEGAIGRNPRDRKKMALVQHGGKAAFTHFHRLEVYHNAAALLECRLGSGRTHQIRVHLSARNHPLIGDPVYGPRRLAARLGSLPPDAAEACAAFPRQALHAALIGFRHPASGESLRFSSLLPPDMEQLRNRLIATH